MKTSAGPLHASVASLRAVQASVGILAPAVTIHHRGVVALQALAVLALGVSPAWT